jgi:two-component system, OmpR family, response regulator
MAVPVSRRLSVPQRFSSFVFRRVTVCNSAPAMLAFPLLVPIVMLMAVPDAQILIVEDDEEIARLVRDLLAREGFRVETAGDAEAMRSVMARFAPDLVILDLMLPGEDGLSICRGLRARGGVPVLMLTAKSEDIDRIVGLEMGADDYLAKPFNPRELLARVRAILRRTRGETQPQANRRYGFEGFVIDLDARVLEAPDGEPIALTSAEFDLLACFVEHPRRVLSRDQLLDWTRGRGADPFDRTIDMAISRLRKKIEAAAPDARLITTIRNNGYIFVPAVKVLGA